MVKVTGIHSKGRTATCLLRGSNKLVLEEAERSLHDALCVVRCLVHKKFLIAGGAAPEVELVTQLSKWAKTLQVGSAHFCSCPVLQAQILKIQTPDIVMFCFWTAVMGILLHVFAYAMFALFMKHGGY